MLGAIAGDVIGSVYEWHPQKSLDFPLFAFESDFTDDSVLTVATADAILRGSPYSDAYRDFGRLYPNRGYGAGFHRWLLSDGSPRQSWGNGAAMRVSPVGWAFHDVESVLAEAERTTSVTHGHPEGVKGAQSTALAVFLARSGASKDEIRRELTRRFGYNLDRRVDEIRPAYQFNESCQGSVPEAIVAFLDSTSFEHAVRLAISLGGDADTQAAIAGALAEAFYGGVPAPIRQEVCNRLPPEFLDVLDAFERAYAVR
jgi:ADP-ribosylglycohydrolase